MTYRQQKGAFEFGHLFQSSINKKNKNKGIKTLRTLMKWTGKGRFSFLSTRYQSNGYQHYNSSS